VNEVLGHFILSFAVGAKPVKYLKTHGGLPREIFATPSSEQLANASDAIDFTIRDRRRFLCSQSARA
jgi:hypothetical protein